jgi:hypothetical protein
MQKPIIKYQDRKQLILDGWIIMNGKNKEKK